MRSSISLQRLAVIALTLTPAASAWPSWLPALDSLVVRADASSTTSSNTPAATGSSSTSGKTVPMQVTTTNLNTGGLEATATGKDGKNGTTTTGKAKHTEFNQQDPAGSVVMMTPAATLGTQLYKIGNTLTWGWNYTNLQASPTAIDILIACSTASQTWTLTQNMTFAPSGTYKWDTGAFQTSQISSPLPVAMYTMVLYDAEGGPSATGEAGYLAPFDGFKFAMYTPQAYTPIGDWTCSTCSAALSETERRALGFAATMSVITVLSFTWFVAGFGAI